MVAIEHNMRDRFFDWKNNRHMQSICRRDTSVS